jgi:ABC-type nitrate/sulfonate/bicarbonate transport system permease component
MRMLAVKILIGLWMPVVVLVLWQVATTVSPNPFFSSPWEIAHAFDAIASWEWFFRRVWPTLTLTIGGFVAGSITGVVLGIAIAAHRITFAAFGPLAVFIRSMPSAAIIPVILAVFGISRVSLYVAVIVAVAFQVTLVTMLAVHSTDSRLIDNARVVGMSQFAILIFVRVPSATGKILTGIHASLQVALLVAVTVDLLAGGTGMGRFTAEALDTLRLTHMWVAVVVVGTIGVVLHEAFYLAERRLVPWYFQMRKESEVTA